MLSKGSERTNISPSGSITITAAYLQFLPLGSERSLSCHD
ncbi:hypothetical protein Pint_18923 [Pistacia integerrima]|uniref:Uncharacterized protein n=1 Tax=Pistacia integerrima TaxID=434235 RepID=A0ACC0Z1C8_9ROSI|nr:hypothetical protein Pint_18923 [Pistacia integerrima]